MCTGKVAGPVGTGIGSSRSLICGIVANGPKSLLIREAWAVMTSVICSPRCVIPGHKEGYTASKSTAGAGTLPPPLRSSRGHSCLWNLLVLDSFWLVGTCFTLGKAVVSLVKHKAVFQILCPCLVHAASLHEARLPGLDFPAVGGRWMRCK